jgi:hypothetical protein
VHLPARRWGSVELWLSAWRQLTSAVATSPGKQVKSRVSIGARVRVSNSSDSKIVSSVSYLFFPLPYLHDRTQALVPLLDL